MSNSLVKSVVAAKRLLGILDKTLRDAASLGADIEIEPYRTMPFSYAAVGADGLTGIPALPPDTTLAQAQASADIPRYGWIRTEQDAVFVATHVWMGISSPSPLIDTTGQQFVFSGFQIDGSTESGDPFAGQPAVNRQPGNGGQLGFRMMDESNSRWMTTTQTNQVLRQSAIFSPSGGPASYISEGGALIPTEFTFPRSASIRIEAYGLMAIPAGSPLADFFDYTNMRAHLVFHGYKVFGE